jgi:hypothetical protein
MKHAAIIFGIDVEILEKEIADLVPEEHPLKENTPPSIPTTKYEGQFQPAKAVGIFKI